MTDETLEELRERWEADPGSRVFLQLAEEYRRRGHTDDAVAVLEQGLERSPNHLSAKVAMGRCRLEKEEHGTAAAIFEEVLERDPTQLVANRLLVEAYLGQGEPAKAARRLDLYRLLNDSDPVIDDLQARLDAAASSPETRPEPRDDRLLEVSDPPPAPPEPFADYLAEAPGPDEGATPEGEGGTEAEPAGQEAAEGEPFPDLPGQLSRHRYLESIQAEGLFEAPFPSPPQGPPRQPSEEAELFDLLPPVGISEPRPDLLGELFGDTALAEEPPPEALAAEAAIAEEDPDERPSREEPSLRKEPSEEARPAVPRLDESRPGVPSLGEEPPEAPPSAEPIASVPSAEEPFAEEPPAERPSAEGLIAEGPPAEELFAEEPPAEKLKVESASPKAPSVADSATGEAPDEIFPTKAAAAEEARPASEGPSEEGAEESDEEGPDPESSFEEPPMEGIATVTLGNLYLSQGHTERAREVFEKVLLREPGNAAARSGLAAAQGEREEAPADTSLTARELLEGAPPLEGLTERKTHLLRSYLRRIRREA